MSEMSIELSGFDEIDKALAKLVASLTDLRPFWPLVVPLFVGWMREQFATEGAWGGDPWRPLSLRYAAWKTKRYPGRGILVLTGALRGAASNPTRIATPTSLTLRIDDAGRKGGSVVEFIQWGTPRMPARPLIPGVMPEAAEHDVQTIIEEYVDEMAAKLGLK